MHRWRWAFLGTIFLVVGIGGVTWGSNAAAAPGSTGAVPHAAAASGDRGQNLPKLPDETTLRQSGNSPGKVTFRHASHMGDRPDCTRCHPKLFGIVKEAPSTADRAITHAKMKTGRQCGACHNGKAAFGFDNCAACHQM
jgi:c(7)-type cytochrome triheme protein